MAERVQGPFLTHGISRQPAHVRRGDQVEDAENISFDPSFGARRSPPVEFVTAVDGLTATAIRMEPIVRDQDDRFVVILDSGNVRVFDVDNGSEIPVSKSADAEAYLTSGDIADDTIKLVSIADFTIMVNTNVETAVKRSDAYVVDQAHRDFDVMVTHTPEAGTYHRTEGGTDARTAGYYLYDPAPSGDATFAVWESQVLGDGDAWGTTTGNWDDSAQNPGGIKITFKDGDGVNHAVDAEWNFELDTPATMFDLAIRLEQAIRDGGAVDACVSWNPTGTGNQGTLIVTAPYRGSGTSVVSIGTPDDGSLQDFSSLQPFDYSEGTATGGTGSAPSDQFPPLSRWTRVAAPDQPEAQPDSTTLPVAMRRLEAPIYEDTVVDDGPYAYWRLGDEPSDITAVEVTGDNPPFAYWRLGELSGSTAANEIGDDGTYVNGPTLGEPGAVSGDTAVAFNSTNNEYVNIGTLDDFGSQLGDGVTVKFWVNTTTIATESVFHMNGVDGSSFQRLFAEINSSVGGDMRLFLQERGAGETIEITSTPGVELNDGDYHHVAAHVNPSDKTGYIYIDGVNTGASVDADAGTIDDFLDYDHDGAIAAVVGNGGAFTPVFNGTIDEVAVYLGDPSGAIAVNEMGTGDGTYTNNPTIGTAGLLAGDDDTAVSFNGDNNENVDLGTLGDLGSSLGDGVAFEVWLSYTDSTTAMAVGGNYTASNATEMMVILNDFNDGDIAVLLKDDNGDELIGHTGGDAGMADGSAHHLVVTVDPPSNTIEIWVDGAKQSTTYTSQDTPSSFSDFSDNFGLAARFSGVTAGLHFTGTLDEAAIYKSVLPDASIDRHYIRGANALTFDIDLIEWNPRITGDELTNPAPELLKDGVRLADLAYHRNRLVLAGREQIVMSQSGDLFNFFIDNDENQVDSDPIARTLAASRQVTFVDYITPFRKGLMFTTKAGRQFEMNAPEALTPDTAAITPTTAYDTLGVRPANLGERLYLAAAKLGHAQVLEYSQEEAVVRDTAQEVSQHVDGLIPRQIKTVSGSINNRVVLVLPESDHRLYAYEHMFQGRERVQSAWTRWALSETDKIIDIAVIEDYVYLLMQNDDGETLLCKQALDQRASDAGMPFAVHLQLLTTATGSLNGGDTDFDQGFDDDEIDTVVLGPDFDTPGDTREAVRVDANTIRVEGEDLTAGECYIGRAYTSFVEFTRPYPKARGGAADLDSTIWVREMLALYIETGQFSLMVSKPAIADRTAAFEATAGTVAERGRLRLYGVGEADGATLTARTSDHRPMTLPSVEYIVDRVTRRARR